MPAPEPRLRVAVLGGAGYAGGELLRLLAQHPAVRTLRACSRSHAGAAWGAVHPALAHLPEARFEAEEPGAIAGEVDVLFLALPHGESQQVVEPVLAANPALVIDLGADFRVRRRALYEAYYGTHRCFDLAESFVYGLADAEGPRLAGRRRIAAPGCFATATLLALAPLAQAELLESPVLCCAVTGSSGAGAQPGRTTHHPVRAHNLFAYALAGHRHEAEILDRLQAWVGGAGPGCRLVPHSGPFVRGIHATLHARLTRAVPEPLALFHEAYAGRPFVRVLTEPPELAAVVGTNFAHLHAAPREGGREAVVTVVIDNLVKGAAGQAVQAMNLALGFDETAGLAFPGLYPC